MAFLNFLYIINSSIVVYPGLDWFCSCSFAYIKTLLSLLSPIPLLFLFFSCIQNVTYSFKSKLEISPQITIISPQSYVRIQFLFIFLCSVFHVTTDCFHLLNPPLETIKLRTNLRIAFNPIIVLYKNDS